MDITYDLHIHSCLSPCGDNDMTVNNILGMATILGLDAIAVSDHNSAKNLPALFKAAGESGIILVPAIEVCTDEEVHMLCLFPSLDSVLAFDEELYFHLPSINNDVKIFGDQLILDSDDAIIGSETKLLINAVDIGIDMLLPMVACYKGIVVPAHVDKTANSIIANLGYIPIEYGFTCVEVKNPANTVDFSGLKITNSDAHYLQDIAEPVRTLSVATRDVAGILGSIRAGNNIIAGVNP